MDHYRNFAELVAHEPREDYRVVAQRRPGRYAIVAPHGGGIERGTSELTQAVAGTEHALYLFEGLKPSDNARLHITSTHFDEPQCMTLIAECDTVIALHGESGEDASVFVGGLDESLAEHIADALSRAGFPATLRGDSDLDGSNPYNLCNRGRSGTGVQLEMTRGLRASLLATHDDFTKFVSALRGAIDPSSATLGNPAPLRA